MSMPGKRRSNSQWLSCQGIALSSPVCPGGKPIWCVLLIRGVGGFGKMPLNGPFLANAEIEEIVAWIDAGMPEGPPADTTEGG